MKSTLRSPAAAAAILVASMGAVMVAQPAAAQHREAYFQPAVVAAPQALIERFVLRHAGGLEPGQEVRFRLVGAPGARAWLEVPGVLRAGMAEVRPGVYEADYVVRRQDNPHAFGRAVATLQSGGQRVSAPVVIAGDRDGDGWGRRHARDEVAPQVFALTPAQGEHVGDRGWTRLSARFTDEGTGVDPASVVLRLDGRDVTGRARIDGDDIRYAEDLQPGRHVAELVVRDRAGNATRRSWSFDVVEPGRNYGSYGNHGFYGGAGYR